MVTKGSRSHHNTSASQGSEEKNASFMSAAHGRNLARAPEVWDKIRLRQGCWLNKKESKSRLALAAKNEQWVLSLFPHLPWSKLLCSSPSQPSLPVYPQPTYFKGAEDTAITLSVLFNHQMSSGILSWTCLEQTSGSNELFRLLSLSGRVAGCFFIILTLFFFTNRANISGFKVNNDSKANALPLEEVERMSRPPTETVKTVLGYLETHCCKPGWILNSRFLVWSLPSVERFSLLFKTWTGIMIWRAFGKPNIPVLSNHVT